MNNDKFNLLRDFAKWVRVNTNKSANIEMNIWCHKSSLDLDDERTEYRVWVDGVINKSSENLDELVGMIPKFKLSCELNMEVA